MGPEPVRGGRAAAVVLQPSGPNALGIIRSLAREGVPVVAADHDPRALGLVSRHSRAAAARDPLADLGGFVVVLIVPPDLR